MNYGAAGSKKPESSIFRLFLNDHYNVLMSSEALLNPASLGSTVEGCHPLILPPRLPAQFLKSPQNVKTCH